MLKADNSRVCSYKQITDYQQNPISDRPSGPYCVNTDSEFFFFFLHTLYTILASKVTLLKSALAFLLCFCRVLFSDLGTVLLLLASLLIFLKLFATYAFKV